MVKELEGSTEKQGGFLKSCMFIVIVLVVCHFIFLLLYFAPAISTPDAQGYFTQAKIIAKEGKTYLETESPVQYVGPHWLGRGDGRYYTTFPPGLPTILAVIYRIFGPKASLLLNPLMASLSLLGLFLVCRSWIGERWGLLAVGFMVANPFANEHALFGDSHTAVGFFLIWGLYFLIRWLREGSGWCSFLAGLFIGIIPSIRYPEILFPVAVGIFVLLNLKTGRSWRSAIYGAVGLCIPISALLVRNSLAFGSFLRTGYSLSGEQSALGIRHLFHHAVPYLIKIMGEGAGPIFALAVMGLASLCRDRNHWREGVMFLLLIVPITLLYMCYYWRVDPQSMRFLLPTFFIYTIAGVWFLSILYEKYPALVGIGSIVLLTINTVWGLPQSILRMGRLKHNNEILARINSVVESEVPPGSIIIAKEGINQHLDFIGRWRLADATILDLPRRRSPQIFSGRRDPAERKQRNLEAKLRYENLSEFEIFDLFSSDVWEWAENGSRVFWIMTEERYDNLRWRLSDHGRFELVKEIRLPIRHVLPPPMDQQKGFMRRGPAGPNQIFDLELTGRPLLLIEWLRDPPTGS
ncbi:hypothetical protein DRP53_07850 [candidate division WOR-3 bacterium]|uniref:Glycosyltransferase RgtA/B/C/D-like domain-containing protein n=1 Tax=candidate division WOR-3 bacterium TaxID=2052148 RepID=A0A660SHV2_UNCW3|nr:MAG: hypothetical protein DRP53_07850 [candidate division WOR-3 bacterium]